MSNRASTQPKKRKRACDNSSKCEPVAKKVRHNKASTLEKDQSIEACSSKRKGARRKNSLLDENLSKKGQSFLKSDYEINNNTSTENFIPVGNVKKEAVSFMPNGFGDISSKIINSENFKKLRDLRVLLDRTVVDDYFRQKLPPKKVNPPTRSRQRSRRGKSSRKIDGTENHGQRTLFHFFDINAASNPNPPIDNKLILPLIPIKQEDSAYEKKLSQIEEMQVDRVNVSMKDLIKLCNVKVDLERLHRTEDFKMEIDSISAANGNMISSNAIEEFTYCNPEDWIKPEVSDDVSIDENLARIKIEDVSPHFTPMKMEVSSESLNVTWNEDGQPTFDALEMERSSKIKLTDAIFALRNDRLLNFYDECPDVPMEEEVTVRRDIEQKVPDIFANNSKTSFNSSRLSWPVSDESGIFMSDDSTNFNELSKFFVNGSFDGPGVGNGSNFSIKSFHSIK